MAWRWIDLLCALTPGSRPPFAVVLRTFFVSTFVGSFLPSIGGDAYRAYSLARHDVRLSESAASVLMDRVLGVLAIALVGAIAVVLSPRADIGSGDRRAALSRRRGVRNRRARRSLAILRRRWHKRLPDETAVAVSATGRRVDDGAMRRYSNHHVELLRVLLASVGVRRSASFRPTASAARSPSTCRSSPISF